jgi:hypothetical protein
MTLAEVPAQQLVMIFKTAFILFSILSLAGIWTSLLSTRPGRQTDQLTN